MRKILHVVLFALLATGAVQAQVCIPNPLYVSLGIPGVYPNPAIQNSLASGNQGAAYVETFTIVVPQDTTIDLSALIGFPFPAVSVSVNYQEVTAIAGLPNGLNYVCAPANCQFPGGTDGCIKLSGTPTQGGTFNVSMATAYNVTVPGAVPVIGGSAISVPFPGGLNWSLDINGVGVKDQQTNAFWIAHNAPNPFNGTTVISYNAPKPATISFEVTDLAGKRLHTETVRAIAGINELSYDASGLAAGIYLYKLSNGDQSVTSKMVVH
jgi:Secretion system C-terminal sorting domain